MNNDFYDKYVLDASIVLWAGYSIDGDGSKCRLVDDKDGTVLFTGTLEDCCEYYLEKNLPVSRSR